MKILSPVFENNGKIPSKYTCDGQGINPPLIFSEILNTAKSLVLIVDDPDAVSGIFTHWVIFNIDPKVRRINEGEMSKLGRHGLTSSGKGSYVGPCPPSGTHRYFFKLFALDISLDLPEGIDRKPLENAMKGHILEEATLLGLYSRNKSSW